MTLCVMVAGHDFINHKGDKVSFDSLKQGPIGIYFSAHWCPPCRVGSCSGHAISLGAQCVQQA